MNIDLGAIDREQFRVESRELAGYGAVVLILPQPAKHRWEPGECHMRSLLCSPDGEVLSSGLPKFLNYGEDAWSDALTTECFAAGSHEIADKLDGSLMIRSVVGGEVHWRTRGAESVGEFGGANFYAMMREVDADWEALEDPEIHADRSCLFELTHPKNHIVLRYDEPRLTALGWVDLDDLTPQLGAPESSHIAECFGCWMPEYFPAESGAAALSAVAQARLGAEGFVCQMRTADGTPHLVKFKSAEYMRLHSLKQHASPEKIARMAYLHGARSLDELKAALHADGFDWEAVAFLEPAAIEHFANAAQVDSRLLSFVDALDESGLLDAPTMKDKAVGLKRLCADRSESRLFNYGIRILRGQKAQAADEADALRCGVSATVLRAWRASS